MRAWLLAPALAAWLAPAHAREVWRVGDQSLEISGSLRELLTTTNGTDADDFAAAAASDPRCADAALFADCAAFDTVDDKDVWQSLTRLRIDVSARASKRWSAELIYDHEWRGGTLDVLGDVPPPDTFLGLEEEIDWFGLDARDDHFRWRHRLYRGFVRYEGERLHVTVGRQRLAWGTGRLWNPIDRLAAVGPLVIEGDEFPGNDAIEARWMFSGFDYLQAVYAPGTSSEEARYALRFHGVVHDTDVSLLAGVFAEAFALGGDLAGNLRGAAWRVEVVWTDPSQDVWLLGDAAPSELPEFWQAVFSIDTTIDVWNGLYLLVEHLYDGNALGFGDGKAGPLLPFFGGGPNGPQPIGSERLAGTRVISLTDHTTGFQLGTDLTPALRADLLTLVDWRGGSVAFLPTFAYSGWNALELRIGAQLFAGPRESQYGAQQAQAFAIVEWFF